MWENSGEAHVEARSRAGQLQGAEPVRAGRRAFIDGRAVVRVGDSSGAVLEEGGLAWVGAKYLVTQQGRRTGGARRDRAGAHNLVLAELAEAWERLPPRAREHMPPSHEA